MKTLAHLLAATSLLGLACAPDSIDGEDGDCGGAKCDDADEAAETPCDGSMVDLAGRGLGTGKIAGLLGDPLAKLAFGTGDECPTTFPEIVDKLIASEKCDGHRSMLVSETAQLLGEATDYRSVTFMECEVEEGKRGSVWFSTFGIRAASDLEETEIPTNAEMFAFDPVAGVFNYYETKDEEIEFFGDSEEYVTKGASGQTRRCAGCHTGGGPIMKELNAPWLHWVPDFDTPGHSEIIAGNAKLLGDESDGVDLEGIVVQGNDEWNDRRIEFVKESLGTSTTVADLLRPVFCTVEVNVDSDFGSSVSGGPLREVVTDSTLGGFARIGFSDDEYQAIIESFGSKMAVPDKNDTIGAFTRIQRGEADTNYQEKLIAQGILSEEFVQDVLLVDFTRAVFSTDRCKLLDFAPELDAKDATAEKIRDGFVGNLEDASDLSAAARDFLRNLQEDGDDARATVSKFEEACQAREGTADVNGTEVSAVALDYLTYALNVREQAVELQVFEFDGLSTPVTNVDRSPATRLHPETCELTNRFVSVDPVVEETEEDPDDGGTSDSGDDGAAIDSCEGRCGEFTDGATCQCDDGCTEFDNCCADIETACGGA
jgi:hypothetical protein